jgi:hypothetical protein
MTMRRKVIPLQTMNCALMRAFVRDSENTRMIKLTYCAAKGLTSAQACLCSAQMLRLALSVIPPAQNQSFDRHPARATSGRF